VQEPVEVPPRSQVVIPAFMTVLSMKKPSNDIIIETREVKQGVYVGRTLLPNDRNHFNICVANTTRGPQLLAAGSKSLLTMHLCRRSIFYWMPANGPTRLPCPNGSSSHHKFIMTNVVGCSDRMTVSAAGNSTDGAAGTVAGC